MKAPTPAPTITPKPQWDRLSEELFEDYDFDATPAELANPDWCSRQLAGLGYSVSFTSITPEIYIAQRREHGLEPDHQVISELREVGCVWSYQLQGALYPERGTHPSPLAGTIAEAAAVALYNMVRITQAKRPK